MSAPPTQPDAKDAPTPENPPDLLLQLSCAEAGISIKKIQVLKFDPEWGEDKQEAIELKVTFESADPQLVPEQYDRAVNNIKSVSLKGPEDKTNSVKMSIKHPAKRSTYKIQREKKAPLIKFSGEPKGMKLTISRDKTALQWRTECTLPAGRLVDLVRMTIHDDVVATIESLQPDMFSH